MNSKPPKPKHNGNGNGSARRSSPRGPQMVNRKFGTQLPPSASALRNVNRKLGIVNPPPACTLNPQPSTINSRLALITDWPQRAHDTKYSVTALAEHCKVCVRTLQSFFLHSMKERPRLWISRLRMERALELLRDGSNVNETADLLAYQNHGQFSRAFKRFYGFAPTKHANRRPGVR